MAGSFPWYAGRCAKRHDVIALIEVVALRSGTGWVAVENAQKLFPKSGMVEVRGVDTRSLRLGDWVVFQIAPRERMGRNSWKAVHHRRLYHFTDQSHLGTLEEVRRTLVVEGLLKLDPPGIWMVQVREGEVLQVELVRSANDTLLASGISKLQAYAFDPSSTIQMPAGDGCIELYDLEHDLLPCNTYDWSPDDKYVEEVIRALAGASDPRISDILAWLKLHVDKVTGRLSLSGTDLVGAYGSLRSGELVKRLVADRDLLSDYSKTLRADPKIAHLVESEARLIAEQERASIRAQVGTKLAQEIQDERDDRIAKLEEDLRSHERKKRAEIEEVLASHLAKAQAELERGLGARKAALDADIAELSQRLQSLASETLAVEASVSETNKEIALLREQESAATTNLDRLLAAGAALEAGVKGQASSVIIQVTRPPRAKPVAPSEMKKTIYGSALLTDVGKALMAQFVAFVVAGDVPILTGPDVDDFLLIAENLLSSGVSARLMADPTIIAFEDIWIRAGTGVPSPLAQAREFASGDRPSTMLAVVEKAERSAARFWFPSFADRARRGDLPRRLLVCVTVEDSACEEARSLLHQAIWLDVRSAIVSGAAAIAALTLSSAERRELEPGDRPTDVIEGMRASAQLINHLNVSTAIRAARVAVEASRLTSVAEAEATALAIAQLFIDKTSEDESRPKTLPRGMHSA